MDQQKRLLLTIVLTTLVMLAWMQFFGPKPPAPVPPDAGATAGAPADAGQPPAAVIAAPDAGAPAAEAAPAPSVPEEKIEVGSAARQLTFTNRGAGLTQAIIRNANAWPEYKFRSREKGPDGELKPVNVVQLRDGMPVVGASELNGELSVPLDAMYEVEKRPDELIFRTSNEQASVEKRFRMNPDSYELRVEVRVTNRTGASKRAQLGLVYPAWVDPKTQGGGSFFSPPPEVSQVQCRHAGSNELFPIKEEQTKETFAGPVRFAGFDERYFMGVIFPRFAEDTRCELTTNPDGAMRARVEADLGVLAAGETKVREFGMYLGPKAHEELERVSEANAMGAGLTSIGEAPKPGSQASFNPELTEAIDFGWWAVICRVLLAIMKFSQSVVVNWGIAIVLLTVLVKLVLYPLSVKQMESMEAMRRLQPQMEALQKKYAGDKEKMNLERMRLFQENKVNPLGGCLPLLIQMPVWFALYRTLLSSFELYREPLIAFWIRDLTLHDPLYILPLAMGVTMFITQKMQPQMGDPTQAKVMLYFMPIFFTFIMLSLPAGLTLYIFTNNILSIAQQKWLQYRFAKKAAAAATK